MAAGAVVLLSAGLDSTVNLFRAHQDNNLEIRVAVTFSYGQKAARQEIIHSQNLCERLKIPHKIIELPWLKEISTSALTAEQGQIPKGESVRINDFETSRQTAAAVWVPNRNGVFLNIAAAVAESMDAQFVIPGFNLEEAATFPDNSDDFLRAMDMSLRFSTRNHVQTKCYTVGMDKAEIVRLGQDLGVPFSMLWPCYESQDEICGVCESCQRFLRAMGAAGVKVAGRS